MRKYRVEEVWEAMLKLRRMADGTLQNFPLLEYQNLFTLLDTVFSA